MTGKRKKIILRSDEVQDILSRPPHFLIKYGCMIMGCAVLVLLIGSFIFKYPDKITCKATITRTDPPVWVIAQSTGKIKELFATEGSHIKKNDIIALIDNPAETKEVFKLHAAIDSLHITEGKEVIAYMPEDNLGDIQEYYNSFIKAVTDYNNFVRNNMHDEKIKAEENKLKYYSDYTVSVERQLALSKKQNRINEKNYEREKVLHGKQLTSEVDMETAEQTLIGGRASMEQIKISLVNAKIQIGQATNNISEIRLQKTLELRLIVTALYTAIDNLKNAIRQWKLNYVLESPLDGTVVYNNVWKENQNISVGDKAFSVITNTQSCVIVKAKIPTDGYGKVKTGQPVNIKLDGYPYLEYGTLTGKIRTISFAPDEELYTATIYVEKNAMTSYGKNIKIDGELTGIAEIITDKKSVGERLIYPLRYLFYNN